MSDSSPSSYFLQSSHNLSRDDISEPRFVKCFHLMLPQIPDARPDPDEYHAKMDDDVRVMIGPMRFGWKLDENLKSLTDQQSGDLLWLIISGALDTTNIHSDWNTPQGSTNRLSLFKKALVVAGPALKEAFVSALQENSFKYIRNAGMYTISPENSSGRS